MPTQHKVQDGECILSIAARNSVTDYHTLWNDAANAGLKKLRPNPNMLVIDDMVTLPEPKQKSTSATTGKTAMFVIKKDKGARLRLLLLDAEDKAVKGKKWKLNTPIVASGTIEVKNLPVTDIQGSLTITLREPSAVAPTAAAKPSPTYPPTVVPVEFKDTKPNANPELDTLEVTLKLGSLPSHNHESGVKARLLNLGFLQGLNASAAQTTAAVKRYQLVCLKQKSGSGTLKDIEDDLRKRHDNP